MKIVAPFLLLAACGGAAAPSATAERPAPLPSPPAPVSDAPPPPTAFEGTYSLDTDATLANMEPELAKMPQEQRDAARQIARSLFERLNMTLELRADGSVEMKTAMNDPATPSKTEEQEGTWKKIDDGIMVTSKGKDMRCTKSGPRLTCEETPPSSEGAVVFVQQR